jgi:hypothetical protein
MKIISAIIGFFTDDLPSAAMVIVWTATLWFISKSPAFHSYGAPLFAIGIIAVLIHSTWRRTRPKS